MAMKVTNGGSKKKQYRAVPCKFYVLVLSLFATEGQSVGGRLRMQFPYGQHIGGYATCEMDHKCPKGQRVAKQERRRGLAPYWDAQLSSGVAHTKCYRSKLSIHALEFFIYTTSDDLCWLARDD